MFDSVRLLQPNVHEETVNVGLASLMVGSNPVKDDDRPMPALPDS